MSTKALQIAAIAILFSSQSVSRSAEVNFELGERFAHCAAVTFKGKQSSKNPAAQPFFGGLFTKYLWASVTFTPASQMKQTYQDAMERHSAILVSGKTTDELSSLIVATLKDCDALYAKNIERVEGNVGREKNTEGARGNASPGKTAPLDLLVSLGRPDSQDYNPDGRFVYNYQTTTGNDVYLFDPDAALIRVRVYCDALKGPCKN